MCIRDRGKYGETIVVRIIDSHNNRLSMDQLGFSAETLEAWQGILDQLNLGEMPPKKQPQPPFEEIAKVIQGLPPVLQRAYAERKSTGGQAVIRRLNKFELRNTLRDLFHVKHPDFEPTVVSGLYDFNGNGITAQKTIEPTRSFQDDEEAEGFDNIGQQLVMSDFLLKMLIGASEEVIAMATRNEPQKPFEAETFTAPICTTALAGGSLGKYQREKKEPYDEVFQRWDRYNRIGPDKYNSGMRRPNSRIASAPAKTLPSRVTRCMDVVMASCEMEWRFMHSPAEDSGSGSTVLNQSSQRSSRTLPRQKPQASSKISNPLRAHIMKLGCPEVFEPPTKRL